MHKGERDDEPPMEEWLESLSHAGPWAVFTRRTDEPKLTWLELMLDDAGIAYRRNGHSAHAPILEVDAERLDDAWTILSPVDDMLDDDPMFGGDDA